MQPGRVLIIGAGLAGSLLAVYLAREGWTVELVERRTDPRLQGLAAGRSINLAISARGIKALKRAGLEDTVMKDAIRMSGRMIHPIAGSTGYQPYSADPTRAINSVSRSALNLGLLNAAAAEPNVTVRFDQRCASVDFANGEVSFIDDRTGATRTATADLVVGADGAYSAVRAAMQKSERFNYAQDFLSHGYKELHIPASANGPHAPFAMEKNALHIWPRGESMMIALPNPDAVALMPTLAEDFARNPVGAMVTVRCAPWSRGRVTLLGDAAHAVVPFYGQGANASFEDCEALVDALASSATIGEALCKYEGARVANANAIADMALRNFIEMRDLTGRRSFKWKKKIEHALNRLMPATFVPLYDLVSFSTVPYAEAKARGAANDRAIRTGISVGVSLVVAAVAVAILLVTKAIP